MENSIILGDGIEGLKKIEESSIDLVFTDPPFGITFSGKSSVYNRNQNMVIGEYSEWDENSYKEKTDQWISNATKIIKPTGSLVIVSGWTNLLDILQSCKTNNLILKNHIIWKYQFGVYTTKKFVSSHYHILWYVKGKKYTFNKQYEDPKLNYKDMEDVWVISRPYKKKIEKTPTCLPEELVEKIICYLSNEGDIIVDPFTGSGAIPRIAKKRQRKFIAYEIDPVIHSYAIKYLDI